MPNQESAFPFHGSDGDRYESDPGMSIRDYNDGIIELDTDRAKPFQFTSDRFEAGSYLWKLGDSIIVSFIASQTRGNFRQLVQAILDSGHTVEIPTPLDRMSEIVKKNGYEQDFKYCDQTGEDYEVWSLKPNASEPRAQANPTQLENP
jgi:hypothetical protein